MSEQLFRKKSLDKISSPDKLDDYLKVSSPSLWLIMLAVVILLVGTLVWASVEQLETKINAVASIQSNNVEIVLTGSDADKVDIGMRVYIGKVETTIDNVKFDDLGRTIAICSADLSDGNYKAEIVIESIHPISFLFR